MKRILTLTTIAAFAAGLAVGGAAASPRHATKATTVTVAMHDPGCHWFLAAGKYRKSLTVAGPVSLLNIDEATLRVAGKSGLRLDPVGHKLALTPGVYRITMVKQAPDDNHLLLRVK